MDDNTKNLIQNHIDNNEVCLFMKGTPDAPQCGFSMAVTNMLKLLEVNFQSVNVLEDQNIREGIKVLVTGLLSLNYMLKKNLLVDVIS
jgi:monothiol glutaredoxin